MKKNSALVLGFLILGSCNTSTKNKCMNNNELENSLKECASEGYEKAFTTNEVKDRLSEGWSLIEKMEKLCENPIPCEYIKKKYVLTNFISSLSFANSLGEEAESQGHHPELTVGYGYLVVKIWTFSAQGITEKDFILANAIDLIYENLKLNQ